MAKNLKRLRKALEKESKVEAAKCEFFPTTFELPSEYHIFVEEFKKRPGTIWIMKPAGKAQGKGMISIDKTTPQMSLRDHQLMSIIIWCRYISVSEAQRHH